jgi:cysteine-rich repeat protein
MSARHRCTDSHGSRGRLASRAIAAGLLALGAILAARAPARAVVSFDDYALPVGDNPQSLSATDCDGDGALDLISSSFSGKTVEVYLNDGTGRFPISMTVETPHAPAGADCADFNGDGIFDLAVSGFGQGTDVGRVLIFRGEASGGFTLIGSYQVGSGSRTISTADFDLDGHVDVLVVNERSDNLRILFGDGTGGFPRTAQLNITGLDSPQGATVGRFNADAYPDIVIVSFLGRAPLTLVQSDVSGCGILCVVQDLVTMMPRSRDVASADLNGDGLLDLAAIGIDASIRIFLGVPGGGVVAEDVLPVEPGARALALGDFDRDGVVDLAVTYQDSNSVRIYPGIGPGRFRTDAPGSPTAMNPLGAQAAHGTVNGPELVFLDKPARALARLDASAPGVLASVPLQPLADEPQLLLLANLVEDGNVIDDAVVVTGSKRRSRLRILPGLLDGGYGPPPAPAGQCGNGVLEGAELCDDGNTKKGDGCDPTCQPEIGTVVSMYAVNLNPVPEGETEYPGRDNHLDLLIADARGQVLALMGDGTGRFTDVRRLLNVRSRTPVAVADFNLDGAPDIVFIPKSRREGALAVAFNDGSGVFSPTAMPVAGRFAGPLLAGDFDNDGLVDLALLSKGKPTGFAILFNDGAGPAVPGPTTATPKSLRSLAAADFDEDGRLDILTEYSSRRQAPLLFMATGPGTFAAPQTLLDATFGPLATFDVDKDGHFDIASCGGTAPCRVLYGDGEGNLAEAPFSPADIVGGDLTAGVAADLDGDGTIDVVGVSKADDQAVVLFRPLGHTAPTRRNLSPGRKPGALAVGDLNGDGLPDIVVLNTGSHDMSVFRNTGARAFTESPVRLKTEGTKPSDLALADLDGDGDLDAAVAVAAFDPGLDPQTRPGVVRFRNDGTGNLTALRMPLLVTGSDPQSVALGDLNGDGVPDIVTANTGSDSLSVFLTLPGGGYTGTTFPSGGNGPTDVEIAYLDDDGHADLVVVHKNSNELVVHLNDGSGGFAIASALVPTGRLTTQGLCTGDFDGDGLADVAIASVKTADILVLFGDGAGGWRTERRVFAVGRNPYPIFCGDVDGDGRTDVVFPRRRTGRLDMILTGLP